MFPWFQFTTINLGPIAIQVWGLFVALGLLLSIFIISKRVKHFDLNPERILDLVIWVIVGGFIFARVFHVAFYEPIFYFSDPLEALKVWKGGLSSFGGLFGAAFGFWLYSKKKKIKKKDFIKIFDIFSFAALFGWIVGRVGCFAIHDHIGKHSNFFLAIKTSDGARLEMAFLEILGLLPLAIIFFLLRKKQLPKGWFLSALFIYYGALRFVLDFFRATDITHADARYLGLTPGQYFAIILTIFGLYFWKKRVKSR